MSRLCLILSLFLVVFAGPLPTRAEPIFQGRAPWAPGPPDACSSLAVPCAQIDDFNLTLRAAGSGLWGGPGLRRGGAGAFGVTLSLYKTAELGLSLPIAVVAGEDGTSRSYGPPELRLRWRLGPRMGPAPFGGPWPEAEPYPKALPAAYDLRPSRYTFTIGLGFRPLWPGVRGQGPAGCSASDTGCLAEVSLAGTLDLRAWRLLLTAQVEAAAAGAQSQLRAGGRAALDLFGVATAFSEGSYRQAIDRPGERAGLLLFGGQLRGFRGATLSAYYGRSFGGLSGEHLAGAQIDVPIGLLWGVFQRLSEAVDPFVAGDGWIYDDECAPLFRLGRSTGGGVVIGDGTFFAGTPVAVGTHLWRRGDWLYHDQAGTRSFIQIPPRRGAPTPVELSAAASPWPDAEAARRSEEERLRWLHRYAMAPDPRRRALCAEFMTETVAALTRAALLPTLAERCAQARRDQAEAIAHLQWGGQEDHSGAWAAAVGNEGYVRAVCNDQISPQALGGLLGAVRQVGGLTVAGTRRPPSAGAGGATAIPIPPSWFPPERIPPSRQLPPGPQRVPVSHQLPPGPPAQAALPPGPAPPRQLPAPAPAQSAKAAAIANWNRGSNFNRAHAFDYPHREVPIVKPGGGRGHLRVDGYKPRVEIVSRKMTQLAQVQEETALRYLRELRDKYPQGRPIANVPSSGPLAGTKLVGQQILEVPIQDGPIPQRVVQEAANLGIIIRDVNGKEYR